MPPSERSRYGIFQDLLLIAAAVRIVRLTITQSLTRIQNVGVYYLIRYALNRLEPEDEKKRKATAAAVMQRLDQREREKEIQDGESFSRDGSRPRRARKEDIVLNQYEQVIAGEVIAPEDIAVAFEGEIFGPCTVYPETNNSRYRWIE